MVDMEIPLLQNKTKDLSGEILAEDWKKRKEKKNDKKEK